MKAHIIPLLKKEEELIWEGKTYSFDEISVILNKIIKDGEYDEREMELLEILRFVKENPDKI